MSVGHATRENASTDNLLLVSLRNRVLAMIGAALAMIAFLGLQLVVRYNQVGQSLDSVVTRYEPAATTTYDLVTSIHNMDRRLRIYVSGGAPGYRRLYQRAVSESGDDLQKLQTLLGDERDYARLIADASESRQDWLDKVGGPAMAAMANDAQSTAEQIVDSEKANASFSRLTADTYRLAQFINAEQHSALARSAEAASRLAITLAVALLLLLLMPVAAYVFLRRWILSPIERLRRQVRAAAGDVGHETAITADGPREIRDLGQDAETLRRNLVGQIDQASAARSALEQEGPVVSAIRTELAARTEAAPVGLRVAGELRPAEGVVAGDFWDRMPLGDGRTALMICDVSGHGARAGIVALRLKTAMTMGLLAGNEPATIFHRACDSFSDEPSRFATAVIMIVDPRTGILSWVNAGHPQPRVLRGGGRVDHLGTTGPMLSWLGGTWRTDTTRLGPSDVALGLTDGVLESRNADGTELGDTGLDERLQAIRETTSDPKEVLAQVLAGIRERADDLGRDDVTMIAFRLDPNASAHIPTPR